MGLDRAAIESTLEAYLDEIEIDPNARPEPPPDWELFRACEEYKMMPEGGGMLDQPVWVLVRFRIYREVIARRKRLKELVHPPLQTQGPAPSGGNSGLDFAAIMRGK